jgi:hypothetical protein
VHLPQLISAAESLIPGAAQMILPLQQMCQQLAHFHDTNLILPLHIVRGIIIKRLDVYQIQSDGAQREVSQHPPPPHGNPPTLEILYRYIQKHCLIKLLKIESLMHEAEFLDEIQIEVLRVFLFAIHSPWINGVLAIPRQTESFWEL